MNFKHLIGAMAVLVLVLLLNVGDVTAQGPRPGGKKSPTTLTGTGFTYQGQLKRNGTPVTTSCNFTFDLYDASSGGNHIAGPVSGSPNPASVTGGLFTVQIDFGSGTFQGDERWLQTSAQCTGDGSATALSRQAVQPAPMALALPGMYTQQNVISPNVIGGFNGNTITPSLYGATVSGGGSNGNVNSALNYFATVGGGQTNTASGIGSTVSGGANNTASGYVANVSGGINNAAGGDYSFAAGRRAKANHQGAFVWGDSTDADFTSTANNQFLIRSNAVGIGTTSPSNKLVVDIGSAAPVDSGITISGTTSTFGDMGLRLKNTGPGGVEWYIDSTNNNSGYGGGYLTFVPGPSTSPVFRLSNIGFYSPAGSITDLFVNNISANNSVYSNGPGIFWGGIGTPLAAGDTNITVCQNNGGYLATCASSLRHKDNVANLRLGLETVAQLRPVTFDWKISKEHDLGFVAEEVNEVAPILATHNKDGQIEGVKYGQVTAVLVKGMQEQQQQIEELKKQNQSLRQQNAALDARLAALEKASNATTSSDASTFPTTWVEFGALVMVGLVVARRRG